MQDTFVWKKFSISISIAKNSIKRGSYTETTTIGQSPIKETKKDKRWEHNEAEAHWEIMKKCTDEEKQQRDRKKREKG